MQFYLKSVRSRQERTISILAEQLKFNGFAHKLRIGSLAGASRTLAGINTFLLAVSNTSFMAVKWSKQTCFLQAFVLGGIVYF